MTRPLSGIRVVEAATWLAAPSTAALLADLGADVIKIEPPGGDPWRHFDLRSMGYEHEFALNYGFELDNRGKRSLTVALERPGGPELVRKLCTEADIFVTNLIRRERWGLDAETLQAINPTLIYAAVSGYGETGPDSDRTGFDYAAFWARSGIMALSGEPPSPPPFCRTGQGDHATSLNLLSAILLALRVRDQTGEGQRVEVSLMQTGMWTIAADLAATAVSAEQPQRYDREKPWNPIRNSYCTRDGHWLILGMTQGDRFWSRFVELLGSPTWATEPRYATMASRKQHGNELRSRIETLFAEADLTDWATRLDAAGLVWAPIQTLTEVFDDPQVELNGMLTELNHPSVGSYRTLTAPFSVSGAETSPQGPAPSPGEQTNEILEELGLSTAKISQLAMDGVFG
jgi:crotonobetainyl-CoA:carnitine CoA-transferase CaiB-like acyl-CoA transferase